MWQKLKSLILEDQVFYGILIVLIGVISFLLGRFSVAEPPVPIAEKVIFKKDTSLANVLVPSISDPITTGVVEVVASKTGTKYHRPECPGAKHIKTSNQISFSSVEAAVVAGYTPAANCPGLR